MGALKREKVPAILTDNGSNMVAAFREWVDIESDSEEVVENVEEAALASDSSSPSYQDETQSEEGEEQENGVEVRRDIQL